MRHWLEKIIRKIEEHIKESPKFYLATSVIVILFLPILLTKTPFCIAAFDSKTGSIGDTIGGITAPFLSVIGSLLVYYSFIQQKKANDIIETARKNDRKIEVIDKLLDRIEHKINSFEYPENTINSKTISVLLKYLSGLISSLSNYIDIPQIERNWRSQLNTTSEDIVTQELISILDMFDYILNELNDVKGEKVDDVVKKYYLQVINTEFQNKILIAGNDFIVKCNVYKLTNQTLPDNVEILCEKIKAIKNKLFIS